MAKRRKAAPPADPPSSNIGPDDRIIAGAPSLHDLFQQQARTMLEDAELDEEQKQGILLAMSCPCCGGGAMSYTVKLKR
jgi:hypothetical protein